MAIAHFAACTLQRRELPLQIPEAISFRRTRLQVTDDERPKQVLLFTGLAQILLGASVLITLQMQLGAVLPTATVACAWLIFTGLSGLCGSCYVTTNRHRSPVSMCSNGSNNPEAKKSFIVCFRVYIGMLMVEIILTLATAIHGLYEDLSEPSSKGVPIDSWEPGMSCLAFGLLLTFLCSLMIGAVRKALREYYVRPPIGQGRRQARITIVGPHITIQSALPPPYSDGIIAPSSRRNMRSDGCHSEMQLLAPNNTAVITCELPPSYSEATGFHR